RSIHIDWPRPKSRFAPGTQLRQRHAVFHSAAEIHYLVLSGRTGQLHTQNRHQITRMQTISDLITFPAKTDIFQRPISQPRVDPVSKDTLIATTELTCPGQHAAAIDPNGKIEI